MSVECPPIAGARVLAVFAHPDDESLACGGTLLRAARAGARVSLVSVTPGGIGARAGAPAFDPAVAERRRLELVAAAERLGIAEVVTWPFRDGLLAWWDAAPVLAALQGHLASARPDIVITFGADGLYWHPDHVQVHRQVTRAVEHAGRPDMGLYYVTLPRGAVAGAVRETCEREPTVDPTLWGIAPEAFGLHAAPPTLVVDVSQEIDAKLAALRCHASQLTARHPFTRMDADTARRWLGEEHFHLAPASPVAVTALDRLARNRASADLV